MLPGGSQGTGTTKAPLTGKDPAALIIVRNSHEPTSNSRPNDSCDPEISWSLTTLCMKAARFPQQLFWAEQILWDESHTNCNFGLL